jgi:hypothetical protein
MLYSSEKAAGADGFGSEDPWATHDDQAQAGTAATDGDVTAAEEAELFDASPQLAYIAEAAFIRRKRPMAVLVAMLARLASETSPNVVLPPVTGGPAGLSMLVALVGPSGKGKGTTWTLAQELLDDWPLHSLEVHPKSGEGLVQALGEQRRRNAAEAAAVAAVGGIAEAEDDPIRFRRRWSNLHSWVDEVGDLAAAAGRAASTLMPNLRSMVSGAALGSDLADTTRSRSVLAGTYRIGIGIGVTPRSGDIIYGPQASEGTVQRLVTVRCGLHPGTWRPATLPRTGVRLAPLPAPPSAWARQYFGGLTIEQMEDPRWRPGRWLTLPEAVRTWIEEEEDRRALADDDLDADAVDGHAVLTREKVAVLLDLLHTHDPMTPQAWEWSEVVMRSSRSDMEWQRRIAMSAGQDDAERAGAVLAYRKQGESNETAAIWQKAMELILTTVKDHEVTNTHVKGVTDGPGCTRSCLTSKASRRMQPYVRKLSQADVLVGENGYLIAVETPAGRAGGRPTSRFRLRPGGGSVDIADLVDVTRVL